jgi:hypothetical protein
MNKIVRFALMLAVAIFALSLPAFATSNVSVPEPGSLAMLVSGIGALAVGFRLHRKQPARFCGITAARCAPLRPRIAATPCESRQRASSRLAVGPFRCARNLG